MYKSPIEVFQERYVNELKSVYDNTVLQEVIKVGVNVDKDELIKALDYDRKQYTSGWDDGYASGYEKCRQDIIEFLGVQHKDWSGEE